MAKKTGRPRIEIDRESFEKLCKLQCTLSEIANWFECSSDTIRRWCKRTYNRTFERVYKEHSAEGIISLRRAQFRLAEKSAAMAIWLGKQYLGQHDETYELRKKQQKIQKDELELKKKRLEAEDW